MPGKKVLFVFVSVLFALAAPSAALAAQASPLSPRLVVLSSPQVSELIGEEQATAILCEVFERPA